MCWRAQNINPTFLEIREKVLSENFSEDINRREIGDQMKKDCLFPAVNPRFEKKKKKKTLFLECTSLYKIVSLNTAN